MITTSLPKKNYIEVLNLSQLGTDEEAQGIKELLDASMQTVKDAIANSYSPLTVETFFSLQIQEDEGADLIGKVLLSNQNIYTFQLVENGTILLRKESQEDQSWS